MNKPLPESKFYGLLIAVVSLIVIVFLAQQIVVLKTEKTIVTNYRAPAGETPQLAHTSSDCANDPFREYPLDQKDKYQLVVLCAGYVIPTDTTTSVGVDLLYLKDKTTGQYYSVKNFDGGSDVGYMIAAVDYPRIYIRNCYEGGCGPFGMIELNQGPNDPAHYFPLDQALFRNYVDDYFEIINGRVIVGGPWKLAEFDPETFNLRTLFELPFAGPEAMGTFTESLPFVPAIEKLDATHLKITINRWEGARQDDKGREIPPTSSRTKILEIK